jgi:hypothetical protein
MSATNITAAQPAAAATSGSSAASSASTTSWVCSSQWCSGSDGSWGTNQQGNADQVYIGQVGDGFTDQLGWKPRCPSQTGDNYNDSCFDNWSPGAGAQGAFTRYTKGTGIGVFPYYTLAGPDAMPATIHIFNSKKDEAYNWGADQAADAYNDTFGVPPAGKAYVYNNSITFDAYFADIEQNDYFDQGNQSENRDVFDGFFDEMVALGMQPGVYSSAGFWGQYFGSGSSGTGSIHNTPIYMSTTEECPSTSGCPNSDAAWPTNGFGSFYDNITKWTAQPLSFGGSQWSWFWQYFQSDLTGTGCGADFDSAQMSTMYAPAWAIYVS